jgi:hypothetical protein
MRQEKDREVGGKVNVSGYRTVTVFSWRGFWMIKAPKIIWGFERKSGSYELHKSNIVYSQSRS